MIVLEFGKAGLVHYRAPLGWATAGADEPPLGRLARGVLAWAQHDGVEAVAAAGARIEAWVWAAQVFARVPWAQGGHQMSIRGGVAQVAL